MYLTDEIDQKLLMVLQEGIPICERPYLRIAEEIGGVSEQEVISRISFLKEAKVIRRFSGFFNSRQLGYISALCAAHVAEENLEAAAELLSGFSVVTHNYLREHFYNMWFTVICRGEDQMTRIFQQIERSGFTGKILRFDQAHQFKIRAVFGLEGRTNERDNDKGTNSSDP